jgi:DMSO/TMAO reductase YedYZ molybdopterin-dependent catalytic subunit
LSSENLRKRLPPDQSPINRLLRWGIDHPGITSTNPQISLDIYKLTIEGEVEKPVKLSWKQFSELPKTVSKRVIFTASRVGAFLTANGKACTYEK